MIKTTIKAALLISFLLMLGSCGVRRSSVANLYNPKEVDQLSKTLGIELSNTNIEDDKNIPLYAEASLWLGVPYKYGGNTRGGVDCSGFTHLIFNKVYNMKIPRTTSELDRMKKKKISKNKLQAGDLLFFTTSKNKKTVTHVGLYLKDNFFVHASTSQGVILSRLSEDYYERTWKYAGRIR